MVLKPNTHVRYVSVVPGSSLKASQPNTSGKVIKVAPITPQNRHWCPIQRTQPRRRMKPCTRSWPAMARGSSPGRALNTDTDVNSHHPRPHNQPVQGRPTKQDDTRTHG